MIEAILGRERGDDGELAPGEVAEPRECGQHQQRDGDGAHRRIGWQRAPASPGSPSPAPLHAAGIFSRGAGGRVDLAQGKAWRRSSTLARRMERPGGRCTRNKTEARDDARDTGGGAAEAPLRRGIPAPAHREAERAREGGAVRAGQRDLPRGRRVPRFLPDRAGAGRARDRGAGAHVSRADAAARATSSAGRRY